MKGPGLRLDLEVRRLWRCPNCHRVRKTDGAVTYLECLCTESPLAMKIVEEKRQVRSFADVIARYQPSGEDGAPPSNGQGESPPPAPAQSENATAAEDACPAGPAEAEHAADA